MNALQIAMAITALVVLSVACGAVTRYWWPQ